MYTVIYSVHCTVQWGVTGCLSSWLIWLISSRTTPSLPPVNYKQQFAWHCTEKHTIHCYANYIVHWTAHWLAYRLLMNLGPDRSGSCLILIRKLHDQSGCRLVLIWQVPDWSGSRLIGHRQSWLFPANFWPIFGCFWLFKTKSWLSPADVSSHCHSFSVSAPHIRQPDIRQCLIFKFP